MALAVIGALVLGAGTYATLLGVTANQDAGGDGRIPECQGVEKLHVLSDAPNFDAATKSFLTTGATVDNIATDCRDAGLALYLTVIGVDGNALQSFGPREITSDPTSTHFDFAAVQYAARGVRLDDIGGYAVAFHPYGPAAPSAPNAVTAVAASANSATVSWFAPSATQDHPITDYIVEYSSNAGGTWATFDDGARTETSAVITGLTPGASYVFRVSATSDSGTGSTAQSNAVSLNAPAAPTGIVAAAASTTTASLSWTAPVAVPGAPITDYVVQYSLADPVNWQDFDDGVSTDTTAMVGGLTPGSSYEFRVAAKNPVGTGAWVRDDPITTNTVPSEPRSVTGASGDTNVAVSWTVPLDDGGSPVTDYVVDYSSDDGASWTTFVDAVSIATSATVTGLANGTTYRFRVSAKNMNGTSQPSISQPVVTPATDPTDPRSLAVDPGIDHADVSWTAPASDGGVPILSYSVTTPLGSGEYASCTVGGAASVLDCRLTGLTQNTSYTFTVTAISEVGRTSSATVTASTLAQPTAPSPPLNVFALPQDQAARVSWEAPLTDGSTVVTGYTVTANPGGASCTTAGGLACTVTGLTNGLGYTFTVTATNAAGTSQPSAPSAVVTPATEPGVPQALAATSPGTSGQVNVAWEAPASDGGSAVTDYVVQLSTDAGASWSTYADGLSSGLSASLTGLDDTRTYLVRVAASNVVGTGPLTVPSAPVAPTASAGDPGPVAAIATTGRDDSVKLTWSAPEFRGASVTGYEVQYKCTRVPGSRQDYCDVTAPYQEWSDWYPTGSTATTTVVGLTGPNRAELFDGNDYTFRIRAIISTDGVTNEGAYVETAVPVRPAEGCVPSAPTNVVATVNGTSSIGLAWTRDPGGPPTADVPPIGCLGMPMDPRTHYYVIYRTSADNAAWSAWSTPIDTHSSSTSYLLTGLADDTWYQFEVQEWPDNDNRGPFSQASTAVHTDLQPVAPGKPTAVSAVAGNTTAAVTWAAPAATGGAPITGYRVTAYTDAAGTVQATGMTNPQSLSSEDTFTGLANGTTYYFHVEAQNSEGWSPASDLSSGVVPMTVPGTPGTPTASTLVGDGSAALAWTEPGSTGGSAITDYTVQYSSDGGTSWSSFNDGVSASTTATVTGLTPGRSYTFRVIAINAAGAGAASGTSSAAVPYTIPGVPTGFAATPQSSLAVGATQVYVDLAWAAPLSDGGRTIASYAVQMSSDNGVSWTAATWTPPTPATTPTAHVTGLPVSTAVLLRVRAVNAATRAADADYNWVTVGLTTPTPPAPPAVPNAVTNLVATPGNASATLTWTASVATGAAVSGYSIRYSYVSNGSTVWSDPAVTTTSTTVNVTGLTNATAYTFEVSPTSSSGNGPAATVMATPAAPSVLPPRAVAGLSATNTVGVTLTWTAPATGANFALPTGYVVQRSIDGTSWTTLASVSSDTLTYTASGLTSGTAYQFRVFATSTVGNGVIAAPIAVTPVSSSQYQTVGGTAAWTSAGLELRAYANVLSIPANATRADLTVTATGSMATTPVGNGWGVWVRASLNSSNQISGYCFQLDRGYSNEFILRWWSNGSERGTPWARVKFSQVFPNGFNLDARHTTSVTVTADNRLIATVDGVTVMTTVLPSQSETINNITFTPYATGRWGVRSWSSNVVTITNLTVS